MRILFFGDILLNDAITEKCEEDRTRTPFGDDSLQRLVERHDFSVASLDCSLRVSRQEQPDKIIVATTESALERLAQLKLGLMTVATNHTFDFGLQGYKSTLNALRRLDIQTVGAGRTATEAARPMVIAYNGLKVGFLAYVSSNTTPILATPTRGGANPFELERAMADVRSLKAQVDAVVVCLHWGIEWYRCPSPRQRNAATRLIEAGASLVIGNHPHVIQVAEMVRGCPIFYALGNLIAADIYQNGHLVVKQLKPNLRSIAVSVEFHPDGGLAQVKPWLLTIRPGCQVVVLSPLHMDQLDGVLKLASVNYLAFWRLYCVWMELLVIPLEYRIRAHGVRHILRYIQIQHILRRMRMLSTRTRL